MDKSVQPLIQATDEEIINEVLAGKTQRFAILVERYQRPVYNLMYRYTESVEESADLTQDVFVAAYGKLKSFKPGKGFFSWLYTISLNRARDWYRMNSRRWAKMPELTYELQQTQVTQQTKLEQQEVKSSMNRALARLPEETREILILRYRHERSILEVAEIFNISESAAKMRIKRGLASLQQQLEQDVTHERARDQQRRN